MNEFKAVESTGKEMRTFSTGSVRDNAEGKGRWDLLPFYPLKRLAVHYENGAKKYGDRNWEKGQPANEYLNSAMRHLMRYIAGENGEDHLSAVAWNVFGAIHTVNQVEQGKLPYELIEGLHPDHIERIKATCHERWKESGKAFLAKQQVEAIEKELSVRYNTQGERIETPAGKADRFKRYFDIVDFAILNEYLVNGHSIEWCVDNDIAIKVTTDKEKQA